MTDSRKQMKGRVTPEARQAWEHFCVEMGVTLSSLLEVAGPALLDPTFRAHWKGDERFQQMIAAAKKLDAENLSRLEARRKSADPPHS